MARDETNADESEPTSGSRSDFDEAILPDDVIRPDGATAGGTSGRHARSTGRGAAAPGPDDIAERAVDVLLGLLGRASALARGVLVFAVLACVTGYVLGIAALGGGLRTLWIVVGGAAAIWAIGSVVLAMWRLRVVRTGSAMLVDEVRSLIGDRDSERTVIETVEATEGSDGDGIVALSRQFFSLRGVVDDHRSNFAQLSKALASITTLPAAMALATVIGFGFAGLSVIFALALLL
ncbi:MAG: hypothetical protein ABJH68_16815 [Ilumatobacter sp.]|uniref:hypothetical protein n=1 Tax=Ilumatobacter sp. TaxID=1967498 RepID=UPI0032968E1A